MAKLIGKKLSGCLSYINLRGIQTSAIRFAERKNIAMILSGCGVYDGSEIIEATSCAIHLSSQNANVHFFAPNIEQMHVVNHLTGEVQVDKRNVLQESARIARGKIADLSQLHAANFDGLVVPGGFGAAKNLCNFATQDVNMVVNVDVERVVREFIAGLKPIGLCCIAPVIIAKLDPGCEVTVGMENDKTGNWPYSGTADSIKIFGAKYVQCDVTQVHVDRERRVVTTPAFMKNAEFHQVYEGIGKMINELLKLC